MVQVHPFRFGAAADAAPTRAAWVAQVRRAEELGYATFLVADHYTLDFPPIAALMAAADATTAIRVGSLVFDNDFRHPAQLAREVATLDLLSDGRFELGIGAGWRQADYDQVGLPFDGAGVRIDRLIEALAIIKQFFAQESVTFTGTHYRVSELQASPKPLQRPHPPIFIGGGGRRMLTVAGQEADIVGLHLKANADGTVDASERTTAALERKLAWVRQAAGERFASLELSLLASAVVVTDDRHQAAEARARELAAHGGMADTSADMLLADPYLFIGTVEHIVEQITHLRQQFGISYVVMRPDDVEAFAPVVARLAGK